MNRLPKTPSEDGDDDRFDFFDDCCETAIKLSQRARAAEQRGALTGMMAAAAIKLQHHIRQENNLKDDLALAREARLNDTYRAKQRVKEQAPQQPGAPAPSAPAGRPKH
jgi:hypothetical protein